MTRFLNRTLQARRQPIYSKCLKKKKKKKKKKQKKKTKKPVKQNQKPCQTRILYSEKLSLKTEGEVNVSPDKEKLRLFMAARHALKEIFKGVLQSQVKRH